MADNKQTTTTEEHIPPEAAGPEIPSAAPGDMVVDMDTINELMKKRNEAEQTGPESEKKPEEKAPRKGRPPKADKAAQDKAAKPVRDKMICSL